MYPKTWYNPHLLQELVMLIMLGWVLTTSESYLGLMRTITRMTSYMVIQLDCYLMYSAWPRDGYRERF